MIRFFLVLFTTTGLLPSVAHGEDVPKSKSLDRWVEYYKEVAHGYDVRLRSKPNEPLTVSAEPILVYVNPTIGFGTHGLSLSGPGTAVRKPSPRSGQSRSSVMRTAAKM